MRKFFIIFTILFSCDGSQDEVTKRTESILLDSSGNLNEISTVLSDELWDGAVGKTLKESFSKPIYGLPQREPLFKLRHIPSHVFSGFVTKNRTIIKVKKAPKTETVISYNTYAKPQLVVEFNGPTDEQIIKQIYKDRDSIIALITKNEIKEKQRRIKKSLYKDSEIKKNFNIRLQYPSAYRVAKTTNDFVWLRKDIKLGDLNVMVYKVSKKDNFSTQSYVKIRDSISKLHIQGPVENTYMSVDNGYLIGSLKGVLNSGTNYKEFRGMWEVKNQFMAGPFIGYQFDDVKNNRQIYVDGFVYAPSANKRSYIFELESIIKSIIID